MGFSFGNSRLMMTTLSERVPRQRLALAFAITNGSSPIGAFIGPIVGGAIVDAQGLGFPGLVLAMVSCCWRSSPPWDLAIETRSS
jgi:MFS family permease